MNLHASVYVKKKYDLYIGKVNYKDCTLVSEWNGMAEFKTQQGETIILEKPNNIAALINQVTGSDDKFNGKIIKAAPSILERMD